MIGAQGFFALLLALLLVNELCAEPENVRHWKRIVIIVLEVFDMLLEIAIIVVSFFLFDEYNE